MIQINCMDRGESLGSFIKLVRKTNELTQEELSKITGVSQAAIVKYENDKSEPGIEFIRKFRESFGYDLVDPNITSVIPVKGFENETAQQLGKDREIVVRIHITGDNTQLQKLESSFSLLASIEQQQSYLADKGAIRVPGEHPNIDKEPFSDS